MKERIIQREIIKALKQIGVGYAHVPNGAHLAGGKESRFKQMGALKGDGLYPGFPDLIIWRKGNVAFLEVKDVKGKPTDNQTACHAHMRADGLLVAIVRSADDAIEAVKKWGIV